MWQPNKHRRAKVYVLNAIYYMHWFLPTGDISYARDVRLQRELTRRAHTHSRRVPPSHFRLLDSMRVCSFETSGQYLTSEES